ncbi:MAG: hypothetical protein AAF823_14515 [Planctomycetota bacterium]
MSIAWLEQHVAELQAEVATLEGQLADRRKQADGQRRQMAAADASLFTATDAADALTRRGALTDLERLRGDLADTLAQSRTIAARLDVARAELEKAQADLDHARFVDEHNADPEADPQPNAAAEIGRKLEAVPVVVDSEARTPLDQPATNVLASFVRRRPRTTIATAAAATLAFAWPTASVVSAVSTATSGTAAAASTSAAAAPTTSTLHAALPMPAGTTASLQLRPAVLVAAAALAHTADADRPDALANLLDELPADLKPHEIDALLGPTTGDNRTASRDVLARL